MLTTRGGANRRGHDFLRFLLVWDDRRYPNYYTGSGLDLNLYFFHKVRIYFSVSICVACVAIVVRGLAFPAISPESYLLYGPSTVPFVTAALEQAYDTKLLAHPK